MFENHTLGLKCDSVPATHLKEVSEGQRHVFPGGFTIHSNQKQTQYY